MIYKSLLQNIICYSLMEKHQSIMIFGILSLFMGMLLTAPIYPEKDSNKDLCKDNGGDWENSSCDFETDDEDKADRYLNDQQKRDDFEEERAAEEDALCDDPDAHFDICQSATLAFADKDDDELTQRDVDVLCDASEDYEAHKEQCDKLYDEVKHKVDYSETEEWNEKDYQESKQDDDDDDDNKYIKSINSDDGDDNKKYGFKAKEGDAEVTRYYDDKEEAEEAYENLDRDELTHSDKSFNDWEYDDEEHPALK
jgi:hypothetical protein